MSRFTQDNNEDLGKVFSLLGPLKERRGGGSVADSSVADSASSKRGRRDSSKITRRRSAEASGEAPEKVGHLGPRLLLGHDVKPDPSS
jgi:hypothetical protein